MYSTVPQGRAREARLLHSGDHSLRIAMKDVGGWAGNACQRHSETSSSILALTHSPLLDLCACMRTSLRLQPRATARSTKARVGFDTHSDHIAIKPGRVRALSDPLIARSTINKRTKRLSSPQRERQNSALLCYL